MIGPYLAIYGGTTQSDQSGKKLIATYSGNKDSVSKELEYNKKLKIKNEKLNLLL
jgi:hypothetical protein